MNSTRGLASARGELARAAAGQARREEALGAGVVDQAMIVTVTAPDAAALDALGEVAREMSAAARLKIRPAWRYQAAAFLCGLGVGVLLPDHASIPTTLQGG